MTSKISLSGILFAVICLCSSCLTNDDELVTYDDTAVTSFVLGTVRCYRTVKSSTGVDSTYSYTYSASSTPIYIDQVGRRIYNADSLAVGTDLSRILTTIGTKNNGVALFKNMDDEEWSLYSSADSIDYSQQRFLRVVSNDGQHHVDYTVDIVCHQEYADSFSWNRMPSNQKIASFSKMRAVQAGAMMYLLGTDADNTLSLLSSADGEVWNECALPDGMGGMEPSVADAGGRLALYAGGRIFTTDGSSEWESVEPDVSLQTIIGTCGNEMYAVGVTGNILVSKDNGATWEPDAMEDNTFVDNTKYLPASDISLLTSVTKANKDVLRATIVGNNAVTGAGDTYENAVVWNKVVDEALPQSWTYTNVAWGNVSHTLPRMDGLVAVSYADGILAIGGKPSDSDDTAYGTMYYSPDYGLTWHKPSGFSLPETIAGAEAVTMVADGKGCIFVIASNPGAMDEDSKCVIWRGYQNKLQWQKQERYYE